MKMGSKKEFLEVVEGLEESDFVMFQQDVFRILKLQTPLEKNADDFIFRS